MVKTLKGVRGNRTRTSAAARPPSARRKSQALEANGGLSRPCSTVAAAFTARSSGWTSCVGSIEEGLETLRKEPMAYYGVRYQSNMRSGDWPSAAQQHLLARHNSNANDGVRVTAEESGAFNWVVAAFTLDPTVDERDNQTGAMSYAGAGELGAPLRPGRVDGVVDAPGIGLLGVCDSCDVAQGLMGDCIVRRRSQSSTARSRGSSSLRSRIAAANSQNVPEIEIPVTRWRQYPPLRWMRVRARLARRLNRPTRPLPHGLPKQNGPIAQSTAAVQENKCLHPRVLEHWCNYRMTKFPTGTPPTTLYLDTITRYY